jgi:hypothetical protein
MSLADTLATPPQSDPARRPRPDAPGYAEWDGTQGYLNTPALTERPTTWDDYIRDALPGIDPATVDVQEPVQVRGWDMPQAGGGIIRAHYYRLNLRHRRPGPSIDELVKRVKRAKPPALKPAGQAAFLVALGDLQLGKMDGDGAAGTIDRTLAGLATAAARYKQQRKALSLGPIHLAWLGDCSEGFVSQGGDNAWRTTLTQTEQQRLVRRLMLHAVETFAPLTDTFTQVAVPGNHDQAVRFGGKGITRYDDSQDVESMHAVTDALTLNPDAYSHVKTYTPARDELTVTVDVAGTIVTHAHGHMWRPGKHFDWWSAQAFGDLPPGEADVLLSAHGHHLVIEQRGHRTFIMTPALESESTWWRHRTGQTGNPGILTLATRDGRVHDFTVT